MSIIIIIQTFTNCFTVFKRERKCDIIVYLPVCYKKTAAIYLSLNGSITF